MIDSFVKPLLLVAHPDDCVIFGWPIIRKYNTAKWKIAYMTYDDATPRGAEIKNFWKHEDVEVDFCGVEDNYIDLENKKIVSFDKNIVADKLIAMTQGHDLIVTHGPSGEYGHPHHIFVNEVISKLNVPQIYFSDGNNAHMRIETESMGEQKLERLPLHREVIEQFQHRYTGFYTNIK